MSGGNSAAGMGGDGQYDLIVVGAGIVGLAAALMARRRGLRVAVVERHARCIGASVRNFGLVTVTGQHPGEHWHRACRTRELWLQVAPQAGIAIVQRGLYVLAQRPQAAQVLEAYGRTEMGAGCRLLGMAEAAREFPLLQGGACVLHSPHELRVESCEAVPRLARWLHTAQGVHFHWRTPVLGIDLPRVHTAHGVLRADHCVVCPGHDLDSLYPQILAQAGSRLCSLQMLRVRGAQPLGLPGAVMSDLSLVRYAGYAGLPEAAALRTLLEAQQAEYLRHGVHLIAVQSADGTLVVGDSHDYGDAEEPFGRSHIDALILDELQRVLRLPRVTVVERWSGTYASAAAPVYQTSPARHVALGLVTGGTGASTCFAFADELVGLALGEGRTAPSATDAGAG
jgi:FAD dependent oxidoreductase TIGR03364